jgi:hypothetical protein
MVYLYQGFGALSWRNIMAASFFKDLYRREKASSRASSTALYSPHAFASENSDFLRSAQKAFGHHPASSSYAVKEVPVSALTNGVKSAFAGLGSSYDAEYEDYLWRLKRAEAYRANPAAFINNSQYNNSHRR